MSVEQLPGNGTWWSHDGHLWAVGGQVALPSTLDRAEAEAMVARYNAGEYVCSGCEQWLPKPEAGSRFASRFCEPCWQRYKEANSRICLLCRRPIWDCYC